MLYGLGRTYCCFGWMSSAQVPISNVRICGGCLESFAALNYYTNENITIPLDETLSPADNATKYFNRYNKLKRTFEADSKLIKETKEEIEHLESIATSLDIATAEEDLTQLKMELIESGYKHKSGNTNGKKN